MSILKSLKRNLHFSKKVELAKKTFFSLSESKKVFIFISKTRFKTILWSLAKEDLAASPGRVDESYKDVIYVI